MLDTLIVDLLIVLAAGLFAAVVCRALRVSVLVGYLVAGTVIGRGMFGWVRDDGHALEHLAEGGVFLLLFSIGLEFSLGELWRLGRNLLVGGSVQMALVAAPVGAAAWWGGRDWQATILLGTAAAFSSTVLVFKSLSEWGQTSAPHGRRAIGILLFQDAALVPLLLLVPLLTGTGESAGVGAYVRLGGTSLAFVAAVVAARYALAEWIIPVFASYRSPDLVVLFTLVSLGGVTLGSYAVGLPPAIGAFAAGLIFSGNRWTKQIDALALPFRETFAAVFFVSLGMLFDPTLFLREPLWMAASLAVLVAFKAVAATVALRLTGVEMRASMGMGIGLAHVGEFAFILLLMAAEGGVISDEDYQRMVGLAIGSLVMTPVLLRWGLRWTGAGAASDAEPHDAGWFAGAGSAIVVGAGPIGRLVASQLETSGRDVCLVDLSPINLHGFAQEGFRTVAGDATKRATLRLARVDEAALVVVCVPRDETAIQIVKRVRTLNGTCRMLVRCRYQSNVRKLESAGAERVVSEEAQASSAVSRAVEELG